ncbi:MAG: hypothetical protein FWE44_07305, partial [Defluviitaleaceae bacterium]|nr:hypothetical protein [Defluviitaleaceae bacterium]
MKKKIRGILAGLLAFVLVITSSISVFAGYETAGGVDETQTTSPAGLLSSFGYVPIEPFVNVTDEQELRNAITGAGGSGGTATVIGNITITGFFIVSSWANPNNTTLIIPSGSTLTINSGV